MLVVVHAVTVPLPFRRPFAAAGLLEFLGVRAVPGVESFDGTVYRRTLRLPHGPAIAALSLAAPAGHVRCELLLTDVRDCEEAVARCRRLLDLDADPVAVDGALGRDSLLAPLVAIGPGRRVPGTVDGHELAVRAVLGQQVSVAGARTLAGRLVVRFGEPLPAAHGGLTHLFPAAGALAEADPSALDMPRSRGLALVELTAGLAADSIVIEPDAPREELERQLHAIRGIGPWTAGYIAMRALGDRDAFLPTDLGVKHALTRLGASADPRDAVARAEAWRPWRAYALQYLWASLGSPTAA
jgi:AraC family transcriptional regulator of adaptative response / DNA-3-methyladenine glycosylase II